MMVDEVRDGTSAGFLRAVLAGLAQSPKRLSPKYFYDNYGSMLFDEICNLPEYYLTRAELAIMQARAYAIAAELSCGKPCRVIEPGAGSGRKTLLLLRALGGRRCAEYVPVDIAGEFLELTASRLRSELPWLRVSPLVADFSHELPLPATDTTERTVVYFPGSTIGNFDPDEARRLLARFRCAAGTDGRVLLGVDLKKVPAMLHAAYNDERRVTEAFNKNLLLRINTELGGDFDTKAFYHYAFYAPVPGRVEMHLVSARRQSVRVAGHTFSFDAGESICTEWSYKYDLGAAEQLGAAVGLQLVESWLDDEKRFAVLLFRS
jgi:dimethylhistidine N-methyltransferase